MSPIGVFLVDASLKSGRKFFYFFIFLFFIFWQKYNDVGFYGFCQENVLEGLESVVLNSVISFHLGKSVNKYCMMVVNY